MKRATEECIERGKSGRDGASAAVERGLVTVKRAARSAPHLPVDASAHGLEHRRIVRAALRPLACLLALAGCAAAGTTTVRHPSGDGRIDRNLVSVRDAWGNEPLLNLPPGALTSDAILVSMTDERTCLDVRLRTWSGAGADWDIAAEVDGVTTHARPTRDLTCRIDRPCLPDDSHLRAFSTDHDARIRLHGGRICFERLGRPRRELAFVMKQGAASWRFAWRFDESARPHVVEVSRR